MAEPAASVLEVRDLKTVFRTRGGEIHAVNDVSFHLRKGELLGVVGESGSGKSVTMMSLLRLLPAPPADIRNGQALLNGRDLLAMSPDELRAVRGAKVGFVFQDPMTSLNPVFTLGNRFIRKSVCPIQALIVPNGCSTSRLRTRMARGVRSIRACKASITASCSQRVTRRSTLGVH